MGDTLPVVASVNDWSPARSRLGYLGTAAWCDGTASDEGGVVTSVNVDAPAHLIAAHRGPTTACGIVALVGTDPRPLETGSVVTADGVVDATTDQATHCSRERSELAQCPVSTDDECVDGGAAF